MSFDSLSVAIQDIYGCVQDDTCGKSLRLALVRGELLRAPRGARRLSILSGTAWVSIRGEDVLLSRGGELSLGPSSPGPALVSALGEEALFVEIS
jgi:hypothetical protein